jgi:hypothetical protein
MSKRKIPKILFYCSIMCKDDINCFSPSLHSLNWSVIDIFLNYVYSVSFLLILELNYTLFFHCCIQHHCFCSIERDNIISTSSSLYIYLILIFLLSTFWISSIMSRRRSRKKNFLFLLKSYGSSISVQIYNWENEEKKNFFFFVPKLQDSPLSIRMYNWERKMFFLFH